MATTKKLTADYNYKCAQLRKRKTQFSPAPPFNDLPTDQKALGKQKEEEKGTRDTPISVWTITGDTGKTTFDFDYTKSGSRF